ncbi:MAG: thiamine pyrophosphate-binding protein, partial [Solirubrobacteraceae bacterium]
VLAGAGPALRRLGELTGAVLATSAVANGLFAGDPYDLGIAGGFSSPLAARLLREADVVVAFGAGLNPWTTRHGRLIGPDARVAQVDLDADAIGAHRPVDLGVVGDARATAEALVAALDPARQGTDPTPSDLAPARQGTDPTRSDPALHAALEGSVPSGWRTSGLAEDIRDYRWRSEPYEESTAPGVLDPRTLTIALDDLLPAERTVVVDSGHFMGWPSMYLRVPDAAGFVFPQAFQCVGLGLGNAIGAAIARPDRLTVAALGDGGALLALSELETLGRLGLPMLVVIYDDAAYGAEVHHFRPLGQAVDLARFPPTDFAALAEAAGCRGVTARSIDDLAGVRDWLGARDRPLVLDAKVDPDVCAEWLEEAFR